MGELIDINNKYLQKLEVELILKLLYSSGLRVSEVVNLKKEDINFNEKTGLVRQGKRNKDRMFILSQEVC